jgi:hypothetical protein
MLVAVEVALQLKAHLLVRVPLVVVAMVVL